MKKAEIAPNVDIITNNPNSLLTQSIDIENVILNFILSHKLNAWIEKEYNGFSINSSGIGELIYSGTMLDSILKRIDRFKFSVNFIESDRKILIKHV